MLTDIKTTLHRTYKLQAATAPFRATRPHLSKHQAASLAACSACRQAGVNATLTRGLVIQHASAVLPEGCLGQAVHVHARHAVIVVPGYCNVMPLVIQPAGLPTKSHLTHHTSKKTE
jgi:hypothetical protein